MSLYCFICSSKDISTLKTVYNKIQGTDIIARYKRYDIETFGTECLIEFKEISKSRCIHRHPV